ncbi:polysaccharide deacetylase family sporulation protein PdaB [Thalassobacillus cyri]|uniref:Polysaccharide deacetylase family sporulation protein PdaB n=1 Tax=Thalassobacillus cyri TaxID=571932 RepID=A0A1H3VTH8_9BACI|nr:polysaccharide deacetylase family protein [Thalassobacillus cyri]SDZ78145.1 polysaccharide deacetylase family sporulation protein PdaB [Thalassobacillus cyri]
MEMGNKVTLLLVIVFVGLPLFGKPVMADTYQVEEGDTLKKISDKYGVAQERIVNYNQLLSTTLQTGQWLEIPNEKFKEGADLTTINLGFSEEDRLLGPVPVINPEQITGPVTKEMVYMGEDDKKQIALTFDDGPEDTYTPQILKVLREKGVKATFFVMGQRVRENPAQLQKIQREGHAIGNHTWDHPHLSELTKEEMQENIQNTNAVIEEVTGVKTDLFRPPFGEIKEWQLELLNKEGYESIMWTADSKDWMGISAEEIVERVKKDASPGVIVLQHNYHVKGNFETVEALPQIIDELRAEGYEFVTVPELLD